MLWFLIANIVLFVFGAVLSLYQMFRNKNEKNILVKKEIICIRISHINDKNNHIKNLTRSFYCQRRAYCKHISKTIKCIKSTDLGVVGAWEQNDIEETRIYSNTIQRVDE